MIEKVKFKLSSKFKPAGDQPEAIRRLVDGLESGLSHQTLLGVTGSGKTFTIANVIEAVQRPTLVMVHNKTLAAQLYGEFKEFFPNNSVEYFVSYFDYYQPEAYVPSSDTFIEKDSSVNDHIEQMRLSATKALMERSDAIIVATVSCIYGLGDPATYLRMVLHLDRGEPMDQRTLVRIGIVRRDWGGAVRHGGNRRGSGRASILWRDLPSEDGESAHRPCAEAVHQRRQLLRREPVRIR